MPPIPWLQDCRIYQRSSDSVFGIPGLESYHYVLIAQNSNFKCEPNYCKFIMNINMWLVIVNGSNLHISLRRPVALCRLVRQSVNWYPLMQSFTFQPKYFHSVIFQTCPLSIIFLVLRFMGSDHEY